MGTSSPVNGFRPSGRCRTFLLDVAGAPCFLVERAKLRDTFAERPGSGLSAKSITSACSGASRRTSRQIVSMRVVKTSIVTPRTLATGIQPGALGAPISSAATTTARAIPQGLEAGQQLVHRP
jgi:hypothetical protein